MQWEFKIHHKSALLFYKFGGYSWKNQNFICTIVVFIAISLGVILFFSMASTEGKQDYFEGKVLENSDDYISH